MHGSNKMIKVVREILDPKLEEALDANIRARIDYIGG